MYITNVLNTILAIYKLFLHDFRKSISPEIYLRRMSQQNSFRRTDKQEEREINLKKQWALEQYQVLRGVGYYESIQGDTYMVIRDQVTYHAQNIEFFLCHRNPTQKKLT